MKDLATRGVDDTFVEVRIVIIIDNMDFDIEDNIISYLKVELANFIAIMAAWNFRLAYNSEIIIKETQVEIREPATLNYIIGLFMALAAFMS